MALFGYPLAHENDAERAAMSIQRALADLNRKNAGIGKPELRTRIGLETGQVMVDATGEVYPPHQHRHFLLTTHERRKLTDGGGLRRPVHGKTVACLVRALCAVAQGSV
jgi:hypothetical protein